MNISDVLVGKKVLVPTNFIEPVELTIRSAEPSNLDKGGICLIFTNGTYQHYETIFKIKFAKSN